jgi:hypothetical protein
MDRVDVAGHRPDTRNDSLDEFAVAACGIHTERIQGPDGLNLDPPRSDLLILKSRG